MTGVSGPERSGAGWSGGAGISATDIAAALGQPSPTPAQQRVIEAPPEPALVVAGAGSGKTETMSGRVVWLVANGHVRRDEILGLTFTRKAAGELAERIAHRLAVIDEYGRRGSSRICPRSWRTGHFGGSTRPCRADSVSWCARTCSTNSLRTAERDGIR